MNVIEYIASEVPDELARLLNKYGVNTKNLSIDQLVKSAKQLASKIPEEFYNALFEIHPDREIFETKNTSGMASNTPCIFEKLPEPVKKFYSGEYKTLKILGTIALLVIVIRKI